MNWATTSVIFQMLVWVDTNPSNGSCKQKTAGQDWHELRLEGNAGFLALDSISHKVRAVIS